MAIIVEPIEGPELDRLITSLLNATGAVHQVVEAEMCDPAIGGLEVIGRAADRLRACLAVIAEHNCDDELAVMTEFLAVLTMLIAEEEGFADAFRDAEGPDHPPPGHPDWV
jgi:hypothetical protein